MKHFLISGILCGCLLIGSFYPKFILEHHLRLFDEKGRAVPTEGKYSDEIPLRLEFWFLSMKSEY